MLVETWITSNRTPAPTGQSESTARTPTCPVILRAFSKPSFHLLFHFHLFLLNVRLNVIHQCLLSACPLRGMASCLVSEWIQYIFVRQINSPLLAKSSERHKFDLARKRHSDWGPSNTGLVLRGFPKWLPLQSVIRAELWLPLLGTSISLVLQHVSSRNHPTLGLAMICWVEEIVSRPTMWLSCSLPSRNMQGGSERNYVIV